MKHQIKFTTNLKIAILAIILISYSCSTFKNVNNSSYVKDSIVFTEAGQEILPIQKRPRKKWDNAIIGDLDQDGLKDMILIEHSWRVLISWNNGGTFSKPQVLTKGDLHEVAIADYDFDGLINLIIVQGGGVGSKPRNPLLYQVHKDRTIIKGKQIEGLEKMRGRAAKLIDADADGVLDLLLTGFPTPNQMKTGANHIHKNDHNNFKFLSKLPHGQNLSYKTLVTDFNNDNVADIIFYGGINMVAGKGTKEKNYVASDKQVLGDAENTVEASSISEIDFGNDGDLDLFITCAEHAFTNKTFYDEENKRFAFFERFKPFTSQKLKIDGDFIIENIQISYPNFDVFIGENATKLDFKKMPRDFKTLE